MFGDQVLVDPLCGEAEVALGSDQIPPRLTATGPTAAAELRSGCRIGGRVDVFWRAVVRL